MDKSLENRNEGLQGRDTMQSEENGCGNHNHRDKPGTQPASQIHSKFQLIYSTEKEKKKGKCSWLV